MCIECHCTLKCVKVPNLDKTINNNSQKKHIKKQKASAELT